MSGSSALQPCSLGGDAWLQWRQERRAEARGQRSALRARPVSWAQPTHVSLKSSLLSSSRGPPVPRLGDSQVWHSEPAEGCERHATGWQRPPFSVCFSRSSYISAGVTADCSLSDPSALNSKREKKKIQCTLWFPVRYRKYTQIIFRCKPFAAAAQGGGMESFGQAWTPVHFLCPRRDHYGAGMQGGRQLGSPGSSP